MVYFTGINAMPVKVLLYEDNEALRNSIQTLMAWSNEFELVGAMPHAEGLLEDITAFNPDVLLMDIDMPPSNGVKAVELLRKQYPDLPVIMLTVFEDNDNIVNAIRAGASGYLLKKDMEQLMPAIKDVLNGGAPMTSTVARKVLQLFPAKPDRNTIMEDLTTRESEILHWLIKGYSYKMIAAELQLNIETVRSHIKKIYRKLQVSSATEAIYKATRP
jgi:DNA-binding NarL/FixJ family response regulator